MNWLESFANALGMGVLAATAASQLFDYWRRHDAQQVLSCTSPYCNDRKCACMLSKYPIICPPEHCWVLPYDCLSDAGP